jgi:hypothetical protein
VRNLGRALADLTGRPVVLGMGAQLLCPATNGGLETRLVLPEGALAWTPYATDFAYHPRRSTGWAAVAPAPLDVAAPLPDLAQPRPGTFALDRDTVLEVTASGLWLRPVAEPANSAAVRGVAPDPRHGALVYSAGPSVSEDRAHDLALTVLQRLDEGFRANARLVPADRLGRGPRADGSGPTAVGFAPGRDNGFAQARHQPGAASAASTMPPAPASTPASAPSPARSELGVPVKSAADGPLSATAARSEPRRFQLESALPAQIEPATRPALEGGAAHRGSPGAPDEPPIDHGHSSTPDLDGVSAPASITATRPNPAGPADPPAAPAEASGGGPADNAPPEAGPFYPQPVPAPGASAVVSDLDLVEERSWLRRTLTGQYDANAGSIARLLAEVPGLRGPAGDQVDRVITDLVAARLYLTGDTRKFDDTVRRAAVGPHVPLARCVAAGLRRLPSHRGAARICAPLDRAALAWYSRQRIVTEWSFCPALAGASLRSPSAGGTRILLWSTTARRTALLDPSLPDQVIFLPGSCFKVLRVDAGESPAVLLRELPMTRPGPDGHAPEPPEDSALDEIALHGLEQAQAGWRTSRPTADLPLGLVDRYSGPPGLLRADEAAQPADGASGPGPAPSPTKPATPPKGPRR